MACHRWPHSHTPYTEEGCRAAYHVDVEVLRTGQCRGLVGQSERRSVGALSEHCEAIAAIGTPRPAHQHRQCVIVTVVSSPPILHRPCSRCPVRCRCCCSSVVYIKHAQAAGIGLQRCPHDHQSTEEGLWYGGVAQHACARPARQCTSRAILWIFFARDLTDLQP